ncbi:MAG: replicative DNA helicase [Acidimicrobiia bacterium]|nr:replicative DNA helicase [Acidimicrobiia bacterium]
MPPHNLEAEESVLGAVMLSSDAANSVMDKLAPEDFYVPAHQAIFEAVARLYNSNQPIDIVTVSDSLRRSEEIDRIGGVVYLTELMERVPTASNVDYYATIVEEHALRRSLLQAGARITDFALQTDEEIIDILDNAEQTVLGVAERRVGDGLQPIAPLLQSTLEVIEELEASGNAITGLATGYRDLDVKLAGLHPANLLIVAARPSMGKCLVGSTRVVDPKTGAMTAIEDLVGDTESQGLQHVFAYDETERQLVTASPSAWADNGPRETFCLTTRLGRTITATANHPVLTWTGWRRLDQVEIGQPIAVAGRVDVFGVDRLPEAEVALLGLLIGDGTTTGTSPKFTTADPTLLAELERLARDMGMQVTGHGDHSLTYRIVGRSDRPSQKDVAAASGVSDATVSLALSGKPGPSEATRASVLAAAEKLGYRNEGARPPNPLVGILERHGLWGCVAATKFVPNAVFRLPKDQLARFLSRLYATDGSAWVSGDCYRIEYGTVSEQLARDVQHLLLRFGIVAKLRQRQVQYAGDRRPSFEVAIQDPYSVRLFADQIGILSKERQVAQVVAAAESRLTDRARSRLLPMEAWDLILSEKGTASWADISARCGRPRNHNWHVGQRRPSRRIVSELAEALSSDALRSLANSDVVWDDVVSIEPAGWQRTFDLEVPRYSNFLAGDVVVHNSTLALNIASNIAMDGGTVAVFSMEMSKEEIIQRMLCSVGRVDSMALRTGQLDARGWQRVVNAASKMYPAPVYVDDSASVTVTDIRAKARRLKRQKGLALIVVDYIQLMQGRNRENRQQEIAEISRNLKNLARELDLPIIAVSQLNRGLEAREDKRPRLGDLRESGAIEQDADIVLFIYRHEYYYPDDPESKGLAEVNVAKHRAGATGKVDMTFLPRYTLFADVGRDVGP